jgi:putative ABC transport system ATP-binding protein
MNMFPALAAPPAAARDDAVVALSDVAMTYGSGTAAVRAISQISMRVHRGEVLFLMGPSGSGKTSLLLVLGLLLRPTVGDVTLRGELLGSLDERRMSALRRNNCGYVFQSYNLFPTLTVLENVLVACEVKSIGRAEAMRQAEALLDRVGLSSKRDSYPATLSGGQKQRVAVARALAGDPAIVLADEPTAALDSDTGQQVTALLCDLAHRDQRAVVMVTHDPRITSHADRIITLQDGQIVGARHSAGD